jgi:hypothetical protein
MTKHNKAAMEGEVGYAPSEEKSRRGMGVFATIAILTIVGIAIWLIISNNSEAA